MERVGLVNDKNLACAALQECRCALRRLADSRPNEITWLLELTLAIAEQACSLEDLAIQLGNGRLTRSRVA